VKNQLSFAPEVVHFDALLRSSSSGLLQSLQEVSFRSLKTALAQTT
jgi:hypothetical protein